MGKIVNAIRWLSLKATDANVKTQCEARINAFISQASGDAIGKILKYWDEKSRQIFIKAYFPSIKTRAIAEALVLSTVYELADANQRLELIQYAINNGSDYGINFLSSLGNSIPDRQEIIKTLLEKSETLPIPNRESIFQYLKGKIVDGDDALLEKSFIKQILDYLKSNDQSLVDFGITLLGETFLSDSHHREIAKDMIAFYNDRSGSLQKYDLGVINYLVRIESKMQDVLKEKIVYLIFSNVSPDRPFEIIPSLLDSIAILKLDSDKYEKDYSDLIDRLITWSDTNQKDQIIKKISEILETVSGNKAKEYLNKINPPNEENETD